MRARSFLPATSPVSLRERARSACGALFGILATGYIGQLCLGTGSALPALVAPMGASAVLLFAVPASPLAQPWSILCGNMVASTVGVTVAASVPNASVAAALAVGCSVALMMVLRCLHPPSGAVALTAVLGGPAVAHLGYTFIIWPVGVDTLLLLLAALVFNNLTGRAYPHVPPHPASDHATADPAPMERVGITGADIDAVVKGFDQVLDVSRGDLTAILRQAQFLSYRRQCGHTDCGAIMSRHVVAVAPHVPLREAVALLRRHHIKALPVTDEQAHVLGIVTQGDLLDKAAWSRSAPRLALAQRVHLTLERGRAPHGSVEDVMTRHVRTVRPGTQVIDLALLVLEAGLHYVPVVDDDDKLVGIVTPSDLVAALVADGATRDLKA